MKLEDLYPNFLNLCESDQQAFVSSYRQRRLVDLTPVLKQRDISKIDLSPEEEVVRKLLGMTKRDFINLKQLANTPMDAEEEEEDEDIEAE
jgi:hypothetical protein